MSEFEIQYNSRNLLRAMKLNPLPTSFLKSRLVREVTTHDTKSLQVDQVVGGQTMAAYTPREGGPNLVAKSGYNSKLHVAPYVYEQIAIAPSDVDIRLAGVNEFASNASDVLNQRVAGWLKELNGRFDRLEEKQVAEAIQTGKLTISGNGVSYEIDFGMDAGNLPDVSATAPWSTTSTDIMGQLATWNSVIRDAGGIQPTDLYMGITAAAGFLKNTGVLAALDNRRVNRGEINIRQIAEQRASYIGTLSGPGFELDCWTYQGGYDASGTFTPFINAKKVSMIGPGTDLRMHFGKIENFKTGDFIGERFPMTRVTEDGKQTLITMESSPMAALHDTKSVVTATVIA